MNAHSTDLLRGPAATDVLRFMTAGSVDDGKSTLIGRLLYDSKALLRDQIEALSRSKYSRAAEGELDLALVTDGLEAEREQGITIDVAYRYFSTPRRSFVIADAPGHEQYTRNMVTAASQSDVVIILIDAVRAAEGLRPQTRRHAAIAALMGLKVIVAINKMDLLGWSQAAFDGIRAEFAEVSESLGIEPLAVLPISAKSGANVSTPGDAPWYTGPLLLELLETIVLEDHRDALPLRFPVQRVARWAADTATPGRGYAGRIEQGVARVGDVLTVLPSGQTAKISAISLFDKTLDHAIPGQSVLIELDRDVDVSRGDVLASGLAATTQRFEADLCWLDEAPFAPGRRLLLRQGAQEVVALIEDVAGVRDLQNGLELIDAHGLKLNDIATVRLRTQRPVLADLFKASPATGAFVLIDPVSHQTAAAGMIRQVSEWTASFGEGAESPETGVGSGI